MTILCQNLWKLGSPLHSTPFNFYHGGISSFLVTISLHYLTMWQIFCNPNQFHKFSNQILWQNLLKFVSPLYLAGFHFYYWGILSFLFVVKTIWQIFMALHEFWAHVYDLSPPPSRWVCVICENLREEGMSSHISRIPIQSTRRGAKNHLRM